MFKLCYLDGDIGWWNGYMGWWNGDMGWWNGDMGWWNGDIGWWNRDMGWWIDVLSNRCIHKHAYSFPDRIHANQKTTDKVRKSSRVDLQVRKREEVHWNYLSDLASLKISVETLCMPSFWFWNFRELILTMLYSLVSLVDKHMCVCLWSK
jgi:hypothetical protein